MILKKQFIIISAIIIAFTLSIGFFVFLQTQKLEERITENKVTVEIMEGIFELDYLVNDYLRNPGERIESQWRMKNKTIDNLLLLDIFNLPEEKIILNGLRDNHKGVQLSFSKLQENVQN